MPVLPPKPDARPDNVTLIGRLLRARRDIFASQPARLYGAWMAQQRAVFYDSFLINQPELIRTILEDRPRDFPKSGIIADTLKDLLGNSVFVTNGETWERQRRIIDPAFEGGRLREVFPSMLTAAEASVERLRVRASGQPIEIEQETAHVTADVIFRTLFSIPITDDAATEVYDAFRDYQRTQPVLSPLALIKAPSWVPRWPSLRRRHAARRIRKLLLEVIDRRAREIADGTAPNDLATKIMTQADPASGEGFSNSEMVDQVAIFFLAGHETSASALAWGLYCLALDQETQTRAALEVEQALTGGRVDLSALRRMPFLRDVFREVLRLYPPVPMMVREAAREEQFRDRAVAPGSLCILSPWHLHRHEKLWQAPDAFDPARWSSDEAKGAGRAAYMPFSKGPRVCTGAGFAMMEGVLLLAMLLRAFRFDLVEGKVPKPVTHLTVRSEKGIFLRLSPR